MNLAFVTDAVFPDRIGGIQKYSAELVRQFVELGIKVTVYTQYEVSNPLKSENIRYIRVLLDDIKKRPLKYTIENHLFSVEAIRLINESTADLIYFQGLTGSGITTIKPKIPFVQNFHGLEMFQHVRGFKATVISIVFRRIVTKILKHSEYVISLGEGISEIIRKQNKSTRVFNIPNAISPGWINANKRERTDSKLRFLMVGRYEWRKGFRTLIRALKNIDLIKENIELTIVGNIPESIKIQMPGVHFTGEIKDESEMQRIYLEHDVLLNCSYSEGMPTVVLEAMASGMPVIATDVGASSEMVDKKNGRLIPPFDALALAQVMKELTLLKVELQDMGYRSIEKVKTRFLWEKVAREHINIFKEIIEENVWN